ncbi:MAG: hypothetical protein CMI06_07250 [Oceanospirillaceae bacterium]|jgi:signal transduction histidine kinase|nr:hypothetical protein [Oceanospirillaceae bacterium]
MADMDNQQFFSFLQSRISNQGQTLLFSLAEQNNIHPQNILQHLFIAKEPGAVSVIEYRMLSTLGHELRTPLNAIIGLGQLLLDETMTISQRDSIETILQAGQHMLAITNRLLSASSEKAMPENFILASELEFCIKILLPTAQAKEITLEVLPGDNIVLHQLRESLRQVLLNLLSNAIKYNRIGGSVTISTQLFKEQAVIRIKDSGYGISDADIARLFRPFVRLESTAELAEGKGFGLSISRELLVRMGGSIDVQSISGRGSTFIVMLPLNFGR